ncbi:hypothetical protein LTR56_026060, partial [Elasticomyces elasticus]
LDLVSKWAESGVIVLEGEEMRNADHEASTEIAGTKRGAIDSCQSSEKKRRTNLIQDGLSLVTPSTPPSDPEYQQHGDGVLAQDPNEGSSEMAISSIHASGSEEHHLVDAGPLNSTPVPDLARSMDSSAECYHNSETGQAHQDRHALSPGTERLIPEDQDAEYVEDSETGLPSPGQGSRPMSTLASRRQVGGFGKVYTNRQQFSGKRPGLRPIVPPISILSPVSSLFMPRNNSSISPSVGSLRSQTSSPACPSPRIATSPLLDLTGLDGTIEETRTTLFPQSQNTDLVRSQTWSPFFSVSRAATSPLTDIPEHGGLIVASRTAPSARSPSMGLVGSQIADPSFSSLRTSTSPLKDLHDGLTEVTRTELLPQMHEDDHFNEVNASATATECFPGGSGTSPSAVLSPFGPNAVDQHLSIPSIEYPQARELSTRATPVGTEAVLDPLFDNFEDVQARLFSPEPSHVSMQIDSEVPDRKVELLLARDRIADLARSHCIKLDAWAATIQLADIHYGLTMPQDEGICRAEVDRVSYAALEGHLIRTNCLQSTDMPSTRGQQKCQKMPLEEPSHISVRNASPFDITCTIEGQFRIAFPANGEVPEIVSERPDGVYLQGVQSKMRRVRHGKVDKSQGHSSFYVLARECLFFSRSGLGEGQVALHEGHLEQHNRMKLNPQAQLYKDSGYAPDPAAVGTVAAQPGLQWSDTEPDSDRGLDSCEEIREHVETPTKDRFLTTAFYGTLPHYRAKTTRTMSPRKAKANRRMVV